MTYLYSVISHDGCYSSERPALFTSLSQAIKFADYRVFKETGCTSLKSGYKAFKGYAFNVNIQGDDLPVYAVRDVDMFGYAGGCVVVVYRCSLDAEVPEVFLHKEERPMTFKVKGGFNLAVNVVLHAA
jgi:hypothetical protein